MPNLNRIDPRTLPQIFAWYDAMAVNGLGQAQPAADAAISQWNDLSGLGRHLVQGTGANQPLFRATGGPTGYPSVNFVDTTDTMLFSDATTRPRPTTVIGLFKNTKADDASVNKIVSFNSQRDGIALDWTTTNTFTGIDDNVLTTAGGVAGDTTTFHVGSWQARPVGAQSALSVDGLHTFFAGAAGTPTSSNISIGHAQFVGHVCEAIVFLDALTPAMMMMIEQALMEKWGLFTSYQLQK